MDAKIKIVAFAVLTLLLATGAKNSTSKNNTLTDAEKLTLIDYSYSILDFYFNHGKDSLDVVPEVDFPKFMYDKVFVTLINKGKVRGCQRGSAEVSSKNIPLHLDLKKAIIKTIEDKRFGGVFKEEEIADVEIILNFLFNKHKIKKNDLNYLKKNIELGIHAIEIINGGKSAYFKESIPITKNYNLKETLEKLCEKAHLKKESYLNPETKIYKYDTLTFKGDCQKNIINLYRYNILVRKNQINNNQILKSISLGKDWFLNNTDSETGLLKYNYLPGIDSYCKHNNHVRQLACLWAFTELKSFLKDESLNPLIQNTLAHYLQYKNEKEDYSFLTIDGKSNLAYNAFLILALINLPEYPQAKDLLIQFSNGILKLQNDDGSYNTYFNSSENTGIDYYPGEAILALMKLHDLTQNKKYLDSVNKAFPYYRYYWRNNKNTAFIPWHTQTYILLYNETKNQDIADFVFEINDWLINNYQILVRTEYLDMAGCFNKKNTIVSAAYLEGINDAYQLAIEVNDFVHAAKYRYSLKLGTRCILQHQFNEKNSFYLKNPEKAIGGFKSSLIENALRNDNTQHATMALIKTYKNEIFDPSSKTSSKYE